MELRYTRNTQKQVRNIVKGYSNSGKTDTLLDIALEYIMQNKKVLFITFEDSVESITYRLYKKIAKVPTEIEHVKFPQDLIIANSYNQNILGMNDIVIIDGVFLPETQELIIEEILKKDVVL